MKTVCLVANGGPTQTTSLLLGSLGRRLAGAGFEVELAHRQMPRGIRPKILWALRDIPASWRRAWRADVLVVHTAMALALPDLLFARAFRRRIVGFAWDLYPESTVAMGRARGRLLTWSYLRAENLAYRLCDVVLAPSAEYVEPLRRRGVLADVYPLWPAQSYAGPQHRAGRAQSPVRVIFAGQINWIRDLSGAVRRIAEAFPQYLVEIQVFSADPVPDDIGSADRLPANLTIVPMGFVSPEQLRTHMERAHYGLVSLSPAFDLPAFPSKALEYLASGLPVLYTGKRLDTVSDILTSYQVGIDLSGPNGGRKIEAKEHDDVQLNSAAEIGRLFFELEMRWATIVDIL